MSHSFIISPSLLAAHLAILGKESDLVIKAGADWLHFDVMDHHYVPNLTFGASVLKSLRVYGITVPIDVHLMCNPVDELIEPFAAAGADYITIHPETTFHIDRVLKKIREKGCKAGIAINPGAPIHGLEYMLNNIDLILVMAVNPGFSGQTFITDSLKKISKLRKIIDKSGLPIRLQVDGGVNLSNIAAIKAAGADTIVAGSAIFDAPHQRYEDVINAFREA